MEKAVCSVVEGLLRKKRKRQRGQRIGTNSEVQQTKSNTKRGLKKRGENDTRAGSGAIGSIRAWLTVTLGKKQARKGQR